MYNKYYNHTFTPSVTHPPSRLKMPFFVFEHLGHTRHQTTHFHFHFPGQDIAPCLEQEPQSSTSLILPFPYEALHFFFTSDLLRSLSLTAGR